MTESALLASRHPSVAAMLVDQVRAKGGQEALRYRDGERWVSLTWQQTQDQVFELAAGLLTLGVGPEDRVAIDANTRVEWILADLAVMCAGGATTTIYPSTGPEGVAFILSDSGSRIVFAEDDVQVAKLQQQREHLPDVERVITFDGTPDGEWVLALEDLHALGAKLQGAPSCNGWVFWHLEHEGELKPLDAGMLN